MDYLLEFSDIKHNLNHLLPEYIDKAEEAFSLAKSAHMGQFRLSGEPYISHPLAVASILGMLNLDHETVIAGLLHDVVEDTAIGNDVIAEKFGESVAAIVDGVTKLKRLNYVKVESYYAENYRKMFLAMANDIRVIFVKLADRLHNMRTCQVMSAQGKYRMARETLDVYAPIANRLGMHNLSLELYELGFAACYPFRYAVLLERMYKFTSGHTNVLMHLKTQIREQAKAHGIEIVDISSREKRLYGIYQKMRVKKLHFSDLMDVYALRICVGHVKDCYHLLGVIHSLYRPKERLFKDYIASAKENGYQSLHTVLYGPYGLSIEIQIRTEEMHLVATKGVAAHWIYKSGTSSINQRKHQEWFKNLVKAQEICDSDAEYINIVKQQVFLDEVYVLTPKGKVLELKRGSTVLDMAYHIHTDVGNHAIYAEVDKVVSPLNQELLNGQKVKIHTDSNIFPKENWLEMVVTSKARSGIRASLKERKIVTGRRLGEQMLRRALYFRGVHNINDAILSTLVMMEGVDNINTLYEKIACDELHVKAIVDQYVYLNQQKELVKEKAIVIKCDPDDGVEISHCCYPIPGDRIVAVLEDKSMHVHRENCRNVRRINESILSAKWDKDISKTFVTVLRVVTALPATNLTYIISVLGDKKAEVERLIVDTNSGQKHYIFVLRVRSLEHLAVVIQNINVIKMVYMVKRELRCGSLSLVQA